VYKIITANGVDFVNPEGDFTLSKTDDVNEYKGEDGHCIVEIIRQNVISASVSYNALTVEQLKTMSEALTTVTNFKLYDAMTDSVIDVTARVSSVQVKKVHHRHKVSVWSLSFKIDEL
jgi:hypothetical protein